MKLSRVLYILIPLAAISCHSSSDATVNPPRIEEKAQSEQGTVAVTIDGKDATPEEQEAFTALAKKLLSDAIAKTVNEGVKELLEKLEITDPIEADLLGVPFGQE